MYLKNYIKQTKIIKIVRLFLFKINNFYMSHILRIIILFYIFLFSMTNSRTLWDARIWQM
jgi:hypothetical protein